MSEKKSSPAVIVVLVIVIIAAIAFVVNAVVKKAKAKQAGGPTNIPQMQQMYKQHMQKQAPPGTVPPKGGG